MVMKPTFNRAVGLQRWWDPQLVFTGVSIMGVNPENGEPVTRIRHGELSEQ